MKKGRKGVGRELTKDERDQIVARVIQAGFCPFEMVEDGKPLNTCPLGFPGCGCADEWMYNPYLKGREEPTASGRPEEPV